MLSLKTVKITAITNANNKNINNKKADNNSDKKEFSDTPLPSRKLSAKRKKTIFILFKSAKKIAETKLR